MSRFTDTLYRRWMAQHGSTGSRRRPSGGMGGMPPMGTAPSTPAPGYSRGASAANDEAYSRPDKQEADYVDKPKS